MARALLSLAFLRGSLAEVPADEIKSLPGWAGPLPSRMWSGHIDGGSDVQDGVARTMKMWYMYGEAFTPPPAKQPSAPLENAHNPPRAP